MDTFLDLIELAAGLILVICAITGAVVLSVVVVSWAQGHLLRVQWAHRDAPRPEWAEPELGHDLEPDGPPPSPAETARVDHPGPSFLPYGGLPSTGRQDHPDGWHERLP